MPSKLLIILGSCMLLGLLGAISLPFSTKVEYSVEVLDTTGNRLRLYTTKNGGYWRLPVKLANLDPRFINLLLTYEDKYFYQHFGVNICAMLRAIGQGIWYGHLVSGGSTITMQTARLLYPRTHRTLVAKLVEIFHALQLEHSLTKEQILTLYLTIAPYGGNIQGVRAASLLYFGKEPTFLNLAEVATLVALPQAPEIRRPDRTKTRLYVARAAVLRRFMAAGLITSQDVIRAAAAPLPHSRYPTPRLAAHLADRLRTAYPDIQCLHTTINTRLQQRLEALLLQQQKSQSLGITLATLVIDNHSWAVRAYVGTGDYFATQFAGRLDMVRAIRSPGSTLKPFIYGLAFDAGFIHPETLIFDRPGPVHGYAPGNFDHRYQGELRVREALQASRNIPAIKILDRLGTNTLLQHLEAAGINLHLPNDLTNPGLSIALGGVGLTLEDLTRLYAGLANKGSVRQLRLLDQSTTSLGSTTNNIPILSPVATWYITDILAESQPPDGFTANHQRLAFKTGTSYGLRDAWAIGYDADYTVGVWLGRPDNGYTTNLSGLHSAVPVLLAIFDQLSSAGLAPLLRTRPTGAIIAQNGELPVRLRHFDQQPTSAIAMHMANDELHIIYPPAGAVIELAGNKPARIHLDIDGGQAPFYLLVNGYPIAHTSDQHTLDWLPQTNGAALLTVLDAIGHSAQVHIRVK